MASWSSCTENITVNGQTQQVATLGCAGLVFIEILSALLAFGGVVAVIMIVFAGIKMINSGGDPKQVAGARATMTYAIIGLLVIFSSFFIISVIAQTTHVACLTKFGFTTCTSPAP